MKRRERHREIEIDR
jgi:hypothetical protein